MCPVVDEADDRGDGRGRRRPLASYAGKTRYRDNAVLVTMKVLEAAGLLDLQLACRRRQHGHAAVRADTGRSAAQGQPAPGTSTWVVNTWPLPGVTISVSVMPRHWAAVMNSVVAS